MEIYLELSEDVRRSLIGRRIDIVSILRRSDIVQGVDVIDNPPTRGDTVWIILKDIVTTVPPEDWVPIVRCGVDLWNIFKVLCNDDSKSPEIYFKDSDGNEESLVNAEGEQTPDSETKIKAMLATGERIKLKARYTRRHN